MQTVGPSLRTAVSRDELLRSQAPEILPPALRLEWRTVARERCNVLIEGSSAGAGQVLEALRPHFRAPILEHRPKPGVPVPLPAQGTLVLLEVADLVPREQAKLLRWLHDRNGSVQVVSTCSDRLYPMVEAGRFDASLYYRLNILRFTL
jgi:hypothetical protein